MREVDHHDCGWWHLSCLQVGMNIDCKDLLHWTHFYKEITFSFFINSPCHPQANTFIHLVFLPSVICSSSLVKVRGSHTFLHVFKVFAIVFPSQSFCSSLCAFRYFLVPCTFTGRCHINKNDSCKIQPLNVAPQFGV